MNVEYFEMLIISGQQSLRQVKSNMASRMMGFVPQCRFALSIQTLLLSRGFAARSRTKTKGEDQKSQDNVYLLNYRRPPAHTFSEAMAALRAYSFTKLDQTVELHIKINMGEKKNKINAFHGLMLLPKLYKKNRKVLVFAEGEAAEAAKNAGGDIVGGEELIKKVADGEIHPSDFEQCLCTLEYLNKMKPLQKILKEKTPTTRRGTASDDIASAITTYKQGHPYKCDRLGYINIGVGKLSFTDAEVKQNALAVVSIVNSYKTAKKGKFFERIMLSSSRGPGFRVQLSELVS